MEGRSDSFYRHSDNSREYTPQKYRNDSETLLKSSLNGEQLMVAIIFILSSSSQEFSCFADAG